MEERPVCLAEEAQLALGPMGKGIGGKSIVVAGIGIALLGRLVLPSEKIGVGRLGRMAGSLFLVSLLSMLTVVWHLWAFFGGSFTSGVDPYRWPVMMTMNVLWALFFVGVS